MNDTADTTVQESAPSNRGAAAGRIIVALVASWTALVAIPGAIPWAASDDAARSLAYAVAVTSVIALVALLILLVRSDDMGTTAASVGTAASILGVALVALEVVNLVLIPTDSPYRGSATGIGLLVLLVVALLSMGGMRLGLFEGFKFSALTLAGTLAALLLVGAYLLVTQSLFGRTGEATKDAEWLRLTGLLTGLQTLAFAAAGALLGTAVQAQVTSSTAADQKKADAALGVLEDAVAGATDTPPPPDGSAASGIGKVVVLRHPDGLQGVIADALAEDAAPYGDLGVRRARAAEIHRAVVVDGPTDAISRDDLKTALVRARAIRRG